MKKPRGKFSRAHFYWLWSKLCRISHKVHTARSWFSEEKGTVTGDVWPIFSSSKHICSAQELHQLCSSLSLSFLFSFPYDALSLPAASRLVLLHLAQLTTFTAALPVSLLPLAFFQIPSFSCFYVLLLLLLFSQIALQPSYFIFAILRIVFVLKGALWWSWVIWYILS